MNLPTIEIPNPTLPDVLPTDHQELMNLFYGHWQALSDEVRKNNSALQEGSCDVFVDPNVEGMMRGPNQSEIAAVMPPKVNAAVILGNMHYQIGNGGWSQYDGNGYSDSVDAARALYEGAANVGIENADKVVKLIDEFKKRRSDGEPSFGIDYDSDDDTDDNFDIYDDLDTSYYEIEGESLMQAMLDRFEEITAYSFMAGAYRKAA